MNAKLLLETEEVRQNISKLNKEACHIRPNAIIRKREIQMISIYSDLVYKIMLDILYNVLLL